MQTVPLRPDGGSQRAYRIDTPSGVFSMAVATPSGAGFSGMEISFIADSVMPRRDAFRL